MVSLLICLVLVPCFCFCLLLDFPFVPENASDVPTVHDSALSKVLQHLLNQLFLPKSVVSRGGPGCSALALVSVNPRDKESTVVGGFPSLPTRLAVARCAALEFNLDFPLH